MRSAQAGPASALAEFLSARLDHDDHVYSGNQHGLRPDVARRLLADVAAKRGVLAIHEVATVEGDAGCVLCNLDSVLGWSDTGPCETVRLLAAVYVDHPDYRREWRP